MPGSPATSSRAFEWPGGLRTFGACQCFVGRIMSFQGALSSTLKGPFYHSQRERFPEACPGFEKVLMGNCFAWNCSVKPASAQNRFGSLSPPVPVVECDKPIGPSGNTGLWKMFKKKPAASVEASTSPSAPSQDNSCVISVVEEPQRGASADAANAVPHERMLPPTGTQVPYLLRAMSQRTPLMGMPCNGVAPMAVVST